MNHSRERLSDCQALGPGAKLRRRAQILHTLTASGSWFTGQHCAVDSSRVSYDVGSGRITGAIACFSVGAVLLARTG